MLKSDHILAGVSGSVIVWRWRQPDPFDLLFFVRGADSFYTLTVQGTLTQHIVSAPWGAMAMAAELVEANDPAVAAGHQLEIGAVLRSHCDTYPDGITRALLLDALISDEQKALHAAPEKTLTTLEF